MSTRLRQVVLAAESLLPVGEDLQRQFGLSDPFNDPGVADFGLENAVFAVGDCFVEIVVPVREGTTAGRLLAKDGPGGYMAIFQTSDLASARRRVSDLDIRVVWEIELEDISAMHLHPKDVGGAIVSVDQPKPPASWRWAGPSWIGADIVAEPGGLRAITVRVDDPSNSAERWAAILGEQMDVRDDTAAITLDDGGQVVRFVATNGNRPGIAEIELDLPGAAERAVAIGGATFKIHGCA